MVCGKYYRHKLWEIKTAYLEKPNNKIARKDWILENAVNFVPIQNENVQIPTLNVSPPPMEIHTTQSPFINELKHNAATVI